MASLAAGPIWPIPLLPIHRVIPASPDAPITMLPRSMRETSPPGSAQMLGADVLFSPKKDFSDSLRRMAAVFARRGRSHGLSPGRSVAIVNCSFFGYTRKRDCESVLEPLQPRARVPFAQKSMEPDGPT